MRELDTLQKQQSRKNFTSQGAEKLTCRARRTIHYSQCCSALLAHSHPTMFYIPPSLVCCDIQIIYLIPRRVHSPTTFNGGRCNHTRSFSIALQLEH